MRQEPHQLRHEPLAQGGARLEERPEILGGAPGERVGDDGEPHGAGDRPLRGSTHLAQHLFLQEDRLADLQHRLLLP
jgi:hypothetical protein